MDFIEIKKLVGNLKAEANKEIEEHYKKISRAEENIKSLQEQISEAYANEDAQRHADLKTDLAIQQSVIEMSEAKIRSIEADERLTREEAGEYSQIVIAEFKARNEALVNKIVKAVSKYAGEVEELRAFRNECDAIINDIYFNGGNVARRCERNESLIYFGNEKNTLVTEPKTGKASALDYYESVTKHPIYKNYSEE